MRIHLFPFFVRGSGPTISTAMRRNGSSTAGSGGTHTKSVTKVPCQKGLPNHLACRNLLVEKHSSYSIDLHSNAGVNVPCFMIFKQHSISTDLQKIAIAAFTCVFRTALNV